MKYIQNNLSKINNDNIITFLINMLINDVNDIVAYEEGKLYVKGDDVHICQDNVHMVLRCIVDVSSTTFIPIEWEHILDVSDAYNINDVTNLVIKEEVHYIIEDNTNTITTKLDYNESNSTFAVYVGKKRLSNSCDFIVNGKEIVFNDEFNSGERVILEVREFIGGAVGFVIKSNNDMKYEVIIVNDEPYIQESTKNSVNELYIKDISNDTNYIISMEDEDIYYEPTTITANKTKIKINGDNDYGYIVEMIEGDLYYYMLDVTGLYLRNDEGVVYSISINGNDFIVQQTDNDDFVDELFIKDIGNELMFRMYMTSDEICFDYVNETTESDFNILDQDYNIFSITISYGDVTVSLKDN